MLRFIIHQICLAKFFASLKETSENGTKSPRQSPKIGCRGYKYETSFRVLFDYTAKSDAFDSNSVLLP